MSSRTVVLATLVVAAVTLPRPASAVAQDRAATTDTVVYVLDPVMVTATRGPREASSVPQPVSVVQGVRIEREMPNTISDLFRTLWA